MRTSSFFRTAVLLCAALASAVCTRAEDIKSIHPTGYVTDLAGVIGAEKKARLEALCTELEQKTGAQMAIVTVRSLEGESVLDTIAYQRDYQASRTRLLRHYGLCVACGKAEAQVGRTRCRRCAAYASERTPPLNRQRQSPAAPRTAMRRGVSHPTRAGR